MKKRGVLLMVVLLSCGVNSVPVLAAKTGSPQRQEARIEPARGFEEILDLWRDGRFDAVYERTIPSGRQSRESLVERLSTSDRKPACCWEKLQDVRVTADSDLAATLNAKVGLERKDGSTEYITRRFRMKKEEGLWKISMADILSLAGSGKKKTRK